MASPTTARPDLDQEHNVRLGEPVHAHIVKVGPGEDAAAKVLEARINGTSLEALCGHVWVPSRDPARHPICGICKEIYDMHRAFSEGLPETPGT